MPFISNRLSVYPQANYEVAQQKLLQSMAHLSSGKRLLIPGDAPAEFGIAETFRYQILNADQAKLNIQNAQGMVNSADGWMDSVQNSLRRMSELAIGAVDSSKNQGDRENLDLEFQQLKEEIGRISEDARYNGIQVVGREGLLTYNDGKKTFQLAQIDGSQSYTLPKYVMSGLTSANDQDFLFDSSNPYTLSGDGRYIFYIDSNEQLSRYEIETGMLQQKGNPTTLPAANLEVDEEGRLWYVKKAAGDTSYTLALEDIASWTETTDPIDATGIDDIKQPEFKVYQERIYYVNSKDELVSRSLLDIQDQKVLIQDMTNYNQVAGEFFLGFAGRFLVDQVPPTGGGTTPTGTLRVTNLQTGKSAQFDLGSGLKITNLRLSTDGSKVFYYEENAKSLNFIEIVPDEQPEFVSKAPTLVAENSTGFSGLSLGGSSQRTNFHIHNGPNADQVAVVEGGDVRLYKLGLLGSSVATIEEARESIAAVAGAIDEISLQRSRLGAEQSRLNYTYESLGTYSNNISSAESAITDIDFAKETAELSASQLQNEIVINLMLRSSQLAARAVTLLNR